jgi:hypothetical protein
MQRIKAVLFFLAAAVSIGYLSSCAFRAPGCTDPAALNFDPKAKNDDGSCVYPDPNAGLDTEKPEVEILLPNTSQAISRTLDLHFRLTDNQELGLLTFNLSSDTYGPGLYYSTSREVRGEEDEVELTINLIDEPFVGNHYILVTCVDSAGNTRERGMDFELTDTEGPAIRQKSFTNQVAQGESVELQLAIEDPGALTYVRAEFYASEFASPPLFKFDEIENEPFLPWYDEQDFTYSFSTFNASTGPFEIRVMAEDHSGNVTTITYEGVVQ